MKALRVADPAAVSLCLQGEIHRSDVSRYNHRLHCVLLVAQGMTCPEVARLFGDSTRSIEYFVRRFELQGLAGLLESVRPVRTRRLSPQQLAEIDTVLHKMPQKVGLSGDRWNGKTLSLWILQQYGVQLEVRQCQRLFRQYKFRLHNPPLQAGDMSRKR